MTQLINKIEQLKVKQTNLDIQCKVQSLRRQIKHKYKSS